MLCSESQGQSDAYLHCIYNENIFANCWIGTKQKYFYLVMVVVFIALGGFAVSHQSFWQQVNLNLTSKYDTKRCSWSVLCSGDIWSLAPRNWWDQFGALRSEASTCQRRQAFQIRMSNERFSAVLMNFIRYYFLQWQHYPCFHGVPSPLPKKRTSCYSILP